MYCRNCGKENQPGAAFCVHCGNALPGPENNMNEEPHTADTAPEKKRNIVIALAVVSALLVIALVLSLTGVLGTTDSPAPSTSALPLEDAIDSLFTGAGGTDITPSTIEREPLPEGSVIETGYYTDEPGLLPDESDLLPGLKYFYGKTGVQPYVYLASAINGSRETPTLADMQAFAESKYIELFVDDAHVLLVLFENDDAYRYWFTIGPRAKSVIDGEAGIILGDYIDKYYSDMSLTYGQFFSRVFSRTADRIMSVTATIKR